MNRAELLRFDGVGRMELETRIKRLVELYDAAEDLVASDDVAQGATSEESEAAGELYEQAWERLRSVLKRA